jgi:hypothetical protein
MLEHTIVRHLVKYSFFYCFVEEDGIEREKEKRE